MVLSPTSGLPMVGQAPGLVNSIIAAGVLTSCFCLLAGKAQRTEGDAEVEAAKVCFHLVEHDLCWFRNSPRLFAFLQTKGYAEGAGDSLAGGVKKNLAKVTGNDAKQAEGKAQRQPYC